MAEHKNGKCLLTRLGDRYSGLENEIRNCRYAMRMVRHYFDQYMSQVGPVDEVGKVLYESGLKDLLVPLDAFHRTDVELISALTYQVNALYSLLEELEKVSSFHLKPDSEDTENTEEGEAE